MYKVRTIKKYSKNALKEKATKAPDSIINVKDRNPKIKSQAHPR